VVVSGELEDEGLVWIEQSVGRKVAHLTDEGRAYAQEHRDELGTPWETVTEGYGEELIELRGLVGQVAEARRLLAAVRRKLYRILAEDAAFDAVVTRFLEHHFQSPEVVLGEMSRVCRPGGKVLVADLVSPADEELAARYNELERLRDGTHDRALSPSGLKRLVADAGITGYHSVDGEEDLEAWLDGSETGARSVERFAKPLTRN
jgi:SAM-dependent methyltransferase